MILNFKDQTVKLFQFCWSRFRVGLSVNIRNTEPPFCRMNSMLKQPDSMISLCDVGHYVTQIKAPEG